MTDSTSHDFVMDIAEVHQWLTEHKFKYTRRQVQRMAHERKLPFKPGPDGHRLFIWHSQLEAVLLPDKAA
jgi:hypothetical protein